MVDKKRLCVRALRRIIQIYESDPQKEKTYVSPADVPVIDHVLICPDTCSILKECVTATPSYAVVRKEAVTENRITLAKQLLHELEFTDKKEQSEK